MSQKNEPAVDLPVRATVLADGLAIGRMDTPVGQSGSRHAHANHHLLLASADSAAAEAVIDGAPVGTTPREGGLLVWPAGRMGLVRLAGPLPCVWLEIEPGRLDRAAAWLFGERAVVWGPAGWASDGFVYEAATRLLALAAAPGPGTAVLADSIGTAIAQHVLLKYARPSEAADARGGLAPAVLAAVLAFIDRHLAEPLPLGRLAGVAGLSPYHFARLFRTAVGMPPHQFVLARRLEVAAGLLASGPTPIADVAIRCGFSSQSHFHQHFKSRYGSTPAAFRRDSASSRTQSQDLATRFSKNSEDR